MFAASSKHFEGLATALSSLHIGGEQKGGTIKLFNRESVVCSDGRVRDIPIIPGNSPRGLWRDCGMRYMLRALGVAQGKMVKLEAAPFDFLTSGGALSKEVGRGIDFAFRRRLRELIPLVGVYGGATGRHIMEGKLSVGKWLPVCRELSHVLPERYQDLPAIQESIFDKISVEYISRMDDKKRESWQGYLPEEQIPLLEAPKTRLLTNGQEVAEKPGVATQGRFRYETVIMGTTWYTWIHLDQVRDVEFEAFISALIEWRSHPMIGARKSGGVGLVSFHANKWVEINPRMTLDGTEIGVPIGEQYLEHLATRREEILDLLEKIS